MAHSNIGRRRPFWAALLAALLPAVLSLVACRDDEQLVLRQAEPDITSRFNAEGHAWLNLQISADDNATRAGDDNGQFAGGDDGIDNAVLLLFAGTSEADAKFASAYQMTLLTPEESALSQISKTITIWNDNIHAGDNLYAFVILNNNDGAIAGAASLSFPVSGDLTFADGTTITGGTTLYSAFRNISITQMQNAAGNFIMTNAVLASKPGGTANPTGATTQTLVQIPANRFFPTEAEAKASPAAAIVADRLATKVTVQADAAMPAYIGGNSALTFNAATDLSFAIDNYNTASYIAQHYNTDWSAYSQQPGATSAHTGATTYHRMVEQEPVATGYRTYWAEDINYDAATGLATLADFPATGLAMGASGHCMENTFDTEHMTERNTTSVVLRLQLNGGKTFYTTTATEPDKIYQAEGDIPAAEKAAGTVLTYTDGYCYYRVLVRHFGDELTPWTKTASMLTSETPVVYGDGTTVFDERFLGRYGLVRNHHYTITIDGITHIGTPAIPTLTDASDDIVAAAMPLKMKMKIIPWKSGGSTLLHPSKDP